MGASTWLALISSCDAVIGSGSTSKRTGSVWRTSTSAATAVSGVVDRSMPPRHETRSGEPVYCDRDPDRNADVTDAVHVRKRDRLRHGKDVAEEEQVRTRHRGLIK